jgi:hypothetical protein
MTDFYVGTRQKMSLLAFLAHFVLLVLSHVNCCITVLFTGEHEKNYWLRRLALLLVHLV